MIITKNNLIVKLFSFLKPNSNEKNMILLAGLGNIGKKYEFTRHNYGFLALDEIIKEYNLTKSATKFQSEVFTGQIAENKVIAIKPQTFMNNSGNAIQSAASFYKIPPEKIIVFHDEVDIKLGETRVKQGGGNAGHNGLKSIDRKIGKNYWRYRLGISRPPNPEYEVSDYVLSKFDKKELEVVAEINYDIAKNLPDFLFKKIINKE
jgi:peptidyl-tRNA hydrolase, PTH1 family